MGVRGAAQVDGGADVDGEQWVPLRGTALGEGDQVRLSATGNLAGAADGLAARSWVRQARALDGGIDLVVENARSELPAILTDVAAAGVTVRSVEVTEPDLEAVFLHLTGRALRD